MTIAARLPQLGISNQPPPTETWRGGRKKESEWSIVESLRRADKIDKSAGRRGAECPEGNIDQRVRNLGTTESMEAPARG
jgi:hypothetical protein